MCPWGSWPQTGAVVLRGVAGSARARVTLFAVVVLLATVSAGWVTARAGADESRCDRFAAESLARAAQVTGSGADVLVVGDSYSAGLGLDDAVDSWPSRLPGRVHVAGFSGSGFSRAASPCEGVAFAARAREAVRDVRTGPVVVEGGLNDWDQSPAAITAGFQRLVRVVGDRQLVVVGPALAPSRAGRVPAIDALLARLSDQYGATYVAMMGLDLPYLEDRLHLTADGHRQFGDHVAEQIGALVP